MTLYEIAMFIVPGFLFIQFERAVFPSSSWKKYEDNGYYFLLRLSTIGLINTFLISFLMSKDWFWVNRVSIALTNYVTTTNNFEVDAISYVAQYGYPMLVALGIQIGIYLLICEAGRGISNWNRKRKGQSIATKYNTIWDRVFEKNSDVDGIIVEVEQNGQSIIRGYLSSYSGAKEISKELEVLPSRDIEIEFELDEKRPEKERVLDLDYIDKVYFDIQTGTLVKFYDSEKANKNILNRRELLEKTRDN